MALAVVRTVRDRRALGRGLPRQVAMPNPGHSREIEGIWLRRPGRAARTIPVGAAGAGRDEAPLQGVPAARSSLQHSLLCRGDHEGVRRQVCRRMARRTAPASRGPGSRSTSGLQSACNPHRAAKGGVAAPRAAARPPPCRAAGPLPPSGLRKILPDSQGDGGSRALWLGQIVATDSPKTSRPWTEWQLHISVWHRSASC